VQILLRINGETAGGRLHFVCCKLFCVVVAVMGSAIGDRCMVDVLKQAVVDRMKALDHNKPTAQYVVVIGKWKRSDADASVIVNRQQNVDSCDASVIVTGPQSIDSSLSTQQHVVTGDIIVHLWYNFN